MTMVTADNATRGIWPSQRNATAPAIKSATALTNTDSGVRAPNARLATLGADIDAAGDAADAGGGEVADAEANEQPIAVAARLVRRRHQLGAQQRIDGGDHGERQRAAEDGRRERSKVAAGRQSGKIGKRRQADVGTRSAGDDGSEIGAETGQLAEIIKAAAGDDANDNRWNFRQPFAGVPHRGKGHGGDGDAERLYGLQMLRHLHERDVEVEAAHIAQLYEKQQRRRGVLEPDHHRLRRELDQCSEPGEAE